MVLFDINIVANSIFPLRQAIYGSPNDDADVPDDDVNKTAVCVAYENSNSSTPNESSHPRPNMGMTVSQTSPEA